MIRQVSDKIGIKKIIHNTSFFSVNRRFAELLKQYNEAKQKLINENQMLNDKNRNKIEKNSELERLMKEQKELYKKIRETVANKEMEFQNLGSPDSDSISRCNKKLIILTRKLEINDRKISQINITLRIYNKRIEESNNMICQLADEINRIKSLISTEHSNINWEEFKYNIVDLSVSFEQIHDYKIKELLKRIAKKCFNLEQITAQMIHKVCDKIIKNGKFEKQYDLLKEIDALIIINNKIYDLVDKLISNDCLTSEIIQLLEQLIQLLNIIEGYAHTSLNKEKTLDISSSLGRIKSISELNNRNVLKSYRPAIFFRKKLENYNLVFNSIAGIIMYVERYLISTHDKQGISKVYQMKN